MGLILFTLMVGVAAVPLTDSMTPEDVSRHATFMAFTTTGIFYVSALCYFLRKNNHYAIPVGMVGSAAVGLVLILWYRSGGCK
jgi:RsiW-degrading membrane proteinase PrsW (M82 family)